MELEDALERAFEAVASYRSEPEWRIEDEEPYIGVALRQEFLVRDMKNASELVNEAEQIPLRWRIEAIEALIDLIDERE